MNVFKISYISNFILSTICYIKILIEKIQTYERIISKKNKMFKTN